MKSELYQAIYRTAIFCMVAITGLTIGAALFLCRLLHYNLISRIWLFALALFGAILFLFSVIVFIYFKKKYNKECELEKRMKIEENN